MSIQENEDISMPFQSKRDAIDAFNEMLDDCYPGVETSFGSFQLSDILSCCDPVQYEMAFDELYDYYIEEHFEQLERDGLPVEKDEHQQWADKIEFWDLPGHPGDVLYRLNEGRK